MEIWLLQSNAFMVRRGRKKVNVNKTRHNYQRIMQFTLKGVLKLKVPTGMVNKVCECDKQLFFLQPNVTFHD